jgi:hypothetical protein
MARPLKEVKPALLERVELSQKTIEQNIALTTYGIYMVNMSNDTVRYVSFAAQLPVGNQWNNVQWTEITPIPRTCASNDFQTCVNNGQYVLMATVNCGYQGFCLIAFEDPNGNYFGGGYQIDANCNANAGVALGLN